MHGDIFDHLHAYSYSVSVWFGIGHFACTFRIGLAS